MRNPIDWLDDRWNARRTKDYDSVWQVYWTMFWWLGLRLLLWSFSIGIIVDIGWQAGLLDLMLEHSYAAVIINALVAGCLTVGFRRWYKGQEDNE